MAGDMSAEERRRIKEELKTWKERKHEIDNKERIDRIAEEKKRQAQMQRKIVREREAKRELVEDYKFRKEMDNQRNAAVENFKVQQEKGKLTTNEQLSRIRQREQEMFQKKHLMMMAKEEQKNERANKMASAKDKLASKYSGKVESRLHQQTKAQLEKQRAKFNPDTDDRAEGQTMGGKLPTKNW